jgi:hypothetical protein
VLRPFPSPEDLTDIYRRGGTPAWRKPHALVIDVVDVTGRHALVTTPSLFGLRPEYDAGGKPVLSQVEEIERLDQEHPTLDARSAASLEAVEVGLAEGRSPGFNDERTGPG